MCACVMAGVAGSLQFDGATLPFINGNLAESRELILSEQIGIGTDPKNRSIRNYSDGKKVVNGSFALEVFGSGVYGSAFNALLKAAIGSCSTLGGSGSGGGGTLQFSPAGGTIITVPGDDGIGAIESFTIMGTNSGILTANFSILASDYKFSGITGLSSSFQFETTGSSDDNNPIPYYSAGVTITGAGGDSTIMNDFLVGWSININTNPQLIYTFCEENVANTIHFGLLDVTGSIQYWSRGGVFTKDLQDGASMTIDLGNTVINIPYMVWDNADLLNQGNNAAVVRNASFVGLGTENSAAISI